MAFGGTDYKIPFIIKAWDGGLNTKAQATDLPSNQTPSCSNVWFDDYGAVGTVPGYVTFASGLGTAPVDGLHSFAPTSGTLALIAACNGTIWQTTATSAASGTTFAAIASALSLFTAGVDMKMLTVDNRCIFSNGYSPVYKYNGTTFVRYGAAAPAGTATVASGASGVLSGTFTYWLTYVNADAVESNYSVIATAPSNVTMNALVLSAIPVAATSAGISTKNLYRNTAGVAGTPWLVTALSAAQTAYTDNVADASLKTGAPLDHGVMPQTRFLLEYRGYIFCAGDPANPQRVYYSEQGQREIFPALHYLDVGKGDGMPITGINVSGNQICIHKNDGYGNGRIWILFMPDTVGVSDDTNWSLLGSPVYYSTQADKTLIFANHLTYYLNKTGWYAYNGQDVAQSAADGSVGRFGVDSHSFDIEPTILALNNAVLSKAAAINFDNKIWIAVPNGTATVNDTILVYDFMLASKEAGTGAWAPLTGPGANCFCSHAGKLLAGSSGNIGQVYQLQTGVSNADAAISSYYYTPEICGEKEHRDWMKVWRTLDITFETAVGGVLSVSYINDARTEIGQTETIDMAGTTVLWSAVTWGSSMWEAGTNRQTARIVLRGSVSKKIQFKFSTSSATYGFKIHEMILRYTLKGAR